jgi:hypothetical protein
MEIQNEQLLVGGDSCYAYPEAQIALGKITNRGMFYIPNGKVLTVPGGDFKLIGYKERTHCWFNRNNVITEVIYPNKNDTRRNEVLAVLDGIGFNTIKDNDLRGDDYKPFDFQDKAGIKNYFDVACDYGHIFLDRVAIDTDDNYKLVMLQEPRVHYDYDSPDELPERDGGYICEDCGCRMSEDDGYITHDGRRICCDCYENNYFTCSDCDEVHHIDYMITVGDYCYCEDCIDRNFTRCDCCGEYVSNDYTYTVHDKYGDEVEVCPYCFEDNYSMCTCCDEYYPNDKLTQVEKEDAWYCESCYDERIVTCHDCGEVFDIERQGVLEKDGKTYCDDCHAKHEEDDEAVNE